MKTLVAILILLSFSSAFASENSPSFSCVEQSGFTYQFYSMTGTILVFDENGVSIDSYEELEFQYKIIESLPAVDQYIIRYAGDGGSEVAIVEFDNGQKIGSGEMTDNDQSMECTR